MFYQHTLCNLNILVESISLSWMIINYLVSRIVRRGLCVLLDEVEEDETQNETEEISFSPLISNIGDVMKP